MKKNLWAIGTIACSLVIGSTADARTWHILPGGTGDAPTIQAGVDSAAQGDTVCLANGTFKGDGNRDVDFRGKAITVRSSAGNPDYCTIDCEGSEASPHRGFIFDSGEGLGSVLEGVTVTGGYPEGVMCGFSYSGGSATFKHCSLVRNEGDGLSSNQEITGEVVRLINCTLAYNGGGGARQGWGRLEVSQCTFEGNRNSGVGVLRTAVVVADSRFVSNGSSGVSLGSESGIEISRCDFIENNYYAVAGGELSGGNATESTFSKNGGGIYLFGAYGFTITGCTFRENAGRAVEDRYGYLEIEISKSTFYGNSSGIYSSSPNLTMDRVIVASSTEGCAVECGEYVAVSLSCCDIYGNAGGDWVGCIADQEHTNGNMCANPLFCDAEYGNLKLASLSACLPSNNVCGVQIGAHGLGCYVPVGIDDDRKVPVSGLRIESYPNPFNPSTTITYTAPESGRVVLRIYDVIGRLVRCLVDEHKTAGEHRAVWDGRDEEGASVASGVYFARLENGSRAQSCKITMAR